MSNIPDISPLFEGVFWDLIIVIHIYFVSIFYYIEKIKARPSCRPCPVFYYIQKKAPPLC